jgi:hypothetical protein
MQTKQRNELTNTDVRNAYRTAACAVLSVSPHEASIYINTPEDYAGDSAPEAATIISLEGDCRTAGDEGTLPALLGSYEASSAARIDALDRFASDHLGVAVHIEYINASVAAVWF